MQKLTPEQRLRVYQQKHPLQVGDWDTCLELRGWVYCIELIKIMKTGPIIVRTVNRKTDVAATAQMDDMCEVAIERNIARRR